MPELPEVETIRRQLQENVAGEKIARVEVRTPKILRLPAAGFIRRLKGATIKSVGRRAKLLLINFSNGWTMLTHLKMTGQYLVLGKPDKHVHVIFYFAGGRKLLFRDVRKFGFLKLVKTDELESFFSKEGYGPEPLEKSFTLDKFSEILKKKKKSRLKPLFIDQKFLAGVGNIYAQEICFYAGVNPKRKVGTLKKEEIKKLYEGLRKILTKAVHLLGTSADDYLDIHGHRGGYLKHLKVYQRGGKKYLRCKAILKEIRLGGRGTTYCPKCQR